MLQKDGAYLGLACSACMDFLCLFLFLIYVGTDMLWRSGWGEKQHLLDVLECTAGAT